MARDAPGVSAAGPPAVRLAAAGHVYPDGTVGLAGVTLDVHAGEVLGVAGPNGSGKSTLAALLTGQLRPTTGTVRVGGLDTARHPVRDLAGRVGLVLQDPRSMLFARSVAEELAFGPRNLGLPEPEVRRRVEAAAARFGLEERLRQHPYALAPAARRRLAIAAVLAMAPRVLVLDEPTTGQDHRAATFLAGLLGELRATGTAVVCIAHDLGLLAAVADRLLLLSRGRVVADGPPRRVLADDEAMGRAGLTPPPVVALSRAVPAAGRPPALSVEELAARLREAGSGLP